MSLSGKSTALIASLVLFLIWTLITYILEGRLLTLHRPEAILNRFVYTLVSNILIGIVGSMILIAFILRQTDAPSPSLFGLIGSTRLIIGIVIGMALGFAFFFTLSFPSRHPILIINAYSQVLVVSIAEVIVCWVLVGGSIANMGKSPIYLILAVLLSSFLFGLYHFGHSPPFNTMKMVIILTIVGLFTGVFYFLTRNIYGTIIFHNFMGIKGVTEALANSGRIESFKELQIPIVATAIVALVILVALDTIYLRRTVGYQ
jgi:hypothetical protein